MKDVVRARVTDESGFTLPELMVAIVILGIIIVPLTSAIIVGLLTTSDAQTRLTESQNAVISSAFWAGDVQSADGTVATNGGPPCGDGTGVITVAKFGWADDISPSNVAYYFIKTSAAANVLYRRFCRGSTQISQGTIAPELTTASNPAVVCTPSCVKPTSVRVTMTTPKGFTFSLNGTRRSTS
jgi:prepilin-type N-terminal cleavage/methylation domain-containing protein